MGVLTEKGKQLFNIHEMIESELDKMSKGQSNNQTRQNIMKFMDLNFGDNEYPSASLNDLMEMFPPFRDNLELMVYKFKLNPDSNLMQVGIEEIDRCFTIKEKERFQFSLKSFGQWFDFKKYNNS